MDFKLAGTKKGITALQADIKIPGLPLKIVMEAIEAATSAKNKIINIMNETIQSARYDLFCDQNFSIFIYIKIYLIDLRKPPKDNWPVTEVLSVPIHKRGKLLGSGGVNLKRIMLETGAQVITVAIISIFVLNINLN